MLHVEKEAEKELFDNLAQLISVVHVGRWLARSSSALDTGIFLSCRVTCHSPPQYILDDGGGGGKGRGAVIGLVGFCGWVRTVMIVDSTFLALILVRHLEIKH